MADKKTLAKEMSESTGESVEKTKEMIDAFIEALKFHIKQNDTITIRGFATIKVANREGMRRKVRNIEKAYTYEVDAPRRVLLHLAKDLKKW